MAIRLFLLALFGLVPTVSAQIAEYRIEDIGLDAVAVDLNNEGQVLAWDNTRGVYLYRDGDLTFLAPSGVGIAMNSSGQVLEQDFTALLSQGLWTPDTPNGTSGSFTGLFDFGVMLSALNDRGEIAGTDFNTGILPFLQKTNGEMIYLDTLGESGLGFVLNNRGDVAGSICSSQECRPVLWSEGTPIPLDIGVSGGIVEGVNDRGEVVGYGNGAFLYFESSVTFLGALDGDYTSEALDINNRGEIVGLSRAALSPPWVKAFRHTAEGGMVDLNERIDPFSGWLLEYAEAVNDCGQIAGGGVFFDSAGIGSFHGYLLTPAGGIAQVFYPDPMTTSGDTSLTFGSNEDSTLLNSQRRCIKLQGLFIGGESHGKLDGEYATTSSSIEIERVTEPSLVFIYPRSHSGFEEVMSYYHTDAMTRYIHSIGFPSLRNYQVHLRVNQTGLTGSDHALVGGVNFLSFGFFGETQTAEDAEVIWHENTHALVAEVVDQSAGELSYEFQAINEAVSDYIPSSYFAGSGPPGTLQDRSDTKFSE